MPRLGGPQEFSEGHKQSLPRSEAGRHPGLASKEKRGDPRGLAGRSLLFSSNGQKAREAAGRRKQTLSRKQCDFFFEMPRPCWSLLHPELSELRMKWLNCQRKITSPSTQVADILHKPPWLSYEEDEKNAELHYILYSLQFHKALSYIKSQSISMRSNFQVTKATDLYCGYVRTLLTVCFDPVK